MKATLLELIAAARNVEANWARGDLAAAVNDLRLAADQAEAEFGTRNSELGTAPTAYWLTTDVENTGTDTSIFFTRDERDQAFLDWMRRLANEALVRHGKPADFGEGYGVPIRPEALDELFVEFQTICEDDYAWTGEVTAPSAKSVQSADPLRQFAEDVLALLESRREWDSETCDDIAKAAYEHGLSGESDDGHFIRRNPAAAVPPGPPPRIVVIIEGGLVQDVLGNAPAEVAIVDYDTDGADPDDDKLVPIDQGDGTETDAFARIEDAAPNPQRVAEIFASLNAPPIGDESGKQESTN